MTAAPGHRHASAITDAERCRLLAEAPTHGTAPDMVIDRRYARTGAEIEMVNWLRAQARDRSEDVATGGPRWFLIRVRPNQTREIAIRLLKNRIECWCPRQKTWRRKHRGQRKFMAREIMLPGYLFVRIIPHPMCYAGVLTFDGVAGFIGSGDRPTPAPERELSNLRKELAKPLKKDKASQAFFDMGDLVRVVSGSFRGFEGVVTRPDDAKGRLKVDVDLLGRLTPVDLDLDQVKSLR